MNSVIQNVSNTEEALALCSEFSDQYGVSVHEDHIIAVFLKRKYYEELCKILDHKGFSLASFEAYGKNVLIQFRPKVRK
jgi:hypothetical protein